jgi:hypothetical protein
LQDAGRNIAHNGGCICLIAAFIAGSILTGKVFDQYDTMEIRVIPLTALFTGIDQNGIKLSQEKLWWIHIGKLLYSTMGGIAALMFITMVATLFEKKK